MSTASTNVASLESGSTSRAAAPSSRPASKRIWRQVVSFAIELTWDGGEHGGSFFLFPPSCDLHFCPVINRITIGDRTTDASWYLARLLPIFGAETGTLIDHWTWTEQT